MPLVTLERAVALLQAGAVVGVPTETVYGLAARAAEPAAVHQIFARKGRPADHPLIVHVADAPEEAGVADDRAVALARAFWPGPLTLVLPRLPWVPDAVTGGGDSVGVRAPAHPLVHALLRAVGPLAAPSANPFGRTSPTTAAHVLRYFPDLAVLDGGACAVGLESTIVDLTGPRAALLRPGAVSRGAVEAVIGPVAVGGATRAPGGLPAHYAPRARLVASAAPDADCAREVAAGRTVRVLRAADDAEAYARALYSALHEADAGGVDVIVAELAAPGAFGDAINDRLRRAHAASTRDDDGNS